MSVVAVIWSGEPGSVVMASSGAVVAVVVVVAVVATVVCQLWQSKGVVSWGVGVTVTTAVVGYLQGLMGCCCDDSRRISHRARASGDSQME